MENQNLVTAKSYSLRKKNGGWLGQIVLTSDGMFASVTDYGNFSFAWRCIGNQSFREFILSLEYDYFASKLLQGMFNVKRTRELEHAVTLFSEMILPELKEALRAEIIMEKTADTLKEDD